MKVRFLDGVLLDSPLKVGLCLTEKAYLHWCSKLGIKTPMEFTLRGSDATAHFFDSADENVCLVCLKDPQDKPFRQVAALLTHEAVHIFQRICEDMGETHPSAEFEAYSIQRYTQHLLWAYEKLTK